MILRVLVLIVMLAATSVSAAPEGEPGYSIDWYTIDGGGGTSTGGVFALTGTIGQFDAHPGGAADGAFTLSGGFWAGGSGTPMELMFEDGFETL